MYYEWEWLSDLAVIPAWEIALIGFVAGAFVVCLMWFFDGR